MAFSTGIPDQAIAELFSSFLISSVVWRKESSLLLFSKKKTALSDFPVIFDAGNIEDIESLRGRLYACNRDWVDQDPVVTDKDQLQFVSGQYRYAVEHNGIRYEMLYLPKKNSRRQPCDLFVSLCGGGRQNKPYPYFLRWKYANFLDGDYLCIEDPMYALNSFKKVQWYYGTESVSYLHELVPVLRRIMEQFHISGEQLCFFGSSGGGTAALQLANMIDGSSAIALNPQFDLYRWKPEVTKFFREGLHIDLSRQDMFQRNMLQLTNRKSTFLICMNMASPRDRRQFSDFSLRTGIPCRYGLSQHGNIITVLHMSHGASLHGSFPLELEFVLLQYVLKAAKTHADLDVLRNFSVFYNEVLNRHYVNAAQLAQCDLRSSLLKIYANFIQKNFMELHFQPKMGKNGNELVLETPSASDVKFLLKVHPAGSSISALFDSRIDISGLDAAYAVKDHVVSAGFNEGNYETVLRKFISAAMAFYRRCRGGQGERNQI